VVENGFQNKANSFNSPYYVEVCNEFAEPLSGGGEDRFCKVVLDLAGPRFVLQTCNPAYDA